MDAHSDMACQPRISPGTEIAERSIQSKQHSVKTAFSQAQGLFDMSRLRGLQAIAEADLQALMAKPEERICKFCQECSSMTTAQLTQVTWSVFVGLGGYERLAEAEGQLQTAMPKEHVFTFRAAMPDSDRVKTTAQLTDGAASWASPNSFNARQLWEWMPVDIFVQTFGTTNDVPNLSELISSGVKLRKLQPGTAEFSESCILHNQTIHQGCTCMCDCDCDTNSCCTRCVLDVIMSTS